MSRSPNRLVALASLGLAVTLLAGLDAALAPRPVAAFSLLGHSLGLDQRDFRVNDNFGDAQAHDNTTPHPNYPGATGAVMSIWKAHAEWGSSLHGDGSGDPLGGNLLGSGGANFDNTWQGTTTDAGLGDNVHTESVTGGPLSFTTAGAGGWKVTYSSAVTWDDGPGLPDAGTVDLQSAATHEVGHTLGLGHSTAPGATMAAAGAGLVSARSIEADDMAGIQAIYGAAARGKPVLTGATALSGTPAPGAQLTLTGSGFASTDNEVWFTRVESDGQPAVVSGLAASHGGTRLTLFVPADAAPGDVLVRVPGGGHAALSNAWPLDVAPGPFTLLGPGLGGAFGVPALSGSGDPTAGGGGVTFHVTDVAPSAVGLWFVGLEPAALPVEGGTLFVFPWLLELPVAVGPAGSLDVPAAVPLDAAGLDVVMQMWFHDATGPTIATATNGLRLAIP